MHPYAPSCTLMHPHAPMRTGPWLLPHSFHHHHIAHAPPHLSCATIRGLRCLYFTPLDPLNSTLCKKTPYMAYCPTCTTTYARRRVYGHLSPHLAAYDAWNGCLAIGAQCGQLMTQHEHGRWRHPHAPTCTHMHPYAPMRAGPWLLPHSFHHHHIAHAPPHLPYATIRGPRCLYFTPLDPLGLDYVQKHTI
jgi:hypothetical protein